MGCTQSKIENEEAVSRCKDRKQFMKEAVSARNAFAAAHSAYVVGLKNTGAAINDYTHGESTQDSQSASTVAQPPSEPLVPPPPPPSFTNPIQRAVSMPEMKRPKASEPNGVGPTILEENDDDDEDGEMEPHEKLIARKRSNGRNKSGESNPVEGVDHAQSPPGSAKSGWAVRETPPPQPEQSSSWDYFFSPVEPIPATLEDMKEEDIDRKLFEERREREEDVEKKAKMAAAVEKEKAIALALEEEEKVVASVLVSGGGSVGRNSKRGKEVAITGEKRIAKESANLVKIFENLDDLFLQASGSAHEVSKMLEATRLHYHSNFADNRGHIDHSARVMRVITWNRSFKGIPDVEAVKDDFDSEENETHATVLDKILAWEKKLYDEVKTGELMKFEYQRKIASLNKHKTRGTNSEALEKIKATVSHLHTRYIVDMQSLDSTVLEINRLRDEQLYPKLVQLVDGMATMWETMQDHHEQQYRIVCQLRSLQNSQTLKETTDDHHQRTVQLWAVVQDWHMQFCKLMDNQKVYIKALKNWLKLNLVPIESSLKEKVSSPSRITTPPIQKLLFSWDDYLERLPDEGARNTINNFAAIIHTIVHQQQEEIKLKEKCREIQGELDRKRRQFEDWYRKYSQQRIPDELDPERTEGNIHKDVVQERKSAVDMVEERLKDEKKAHEKMRDQVRDKSLTSLKTHLPELFSVMSKIASDCSKMFKELRDISTSKQQKSSESSS